MRRKYYKTRVAGGLIVREVTNIGNGWHPHLHNIVDGDYLPAQKLEGDISKALGWPVNIRDLEEEYNPAMRGIRTVQGFGSFYGKEKGEKHPFAGPYVGDPTG